MAIGRRLRRLASTDVARGTGDVVDIELLSETFAQFLGDEPREHVGRAAGRKWDDHAHRPRRISLRPGNPRYRGESGGNARKTQKSAARKFHVVPLLHPLRMNQFL